MTKIRVLIADDHAMVRQGLRLVIDAQPDMEVVAEAGDGRAALSRARDVRPSVAVLDVSMPEMNGLDATRALRLECPGTAVVALTRHRDAAHVAALVGAGASGYVLKQSASTELVKAIRAVVSRRPYLDPNVAMEQRTAGRSGRPPIISGRETEVLKLMALGHSNKEIAATLDISVKTVEVHRTNAMRKLGLGGRSDLVRFAVLQGWLRDLA
jgi:DNA-binding NarL/FixJ family response regulator